MSKIKDVIILGAGASASGGAPVQSQLLGEYAKQVLSRSDYFKGSTDKYESRDKQLKDFFNNLWGIDISKKLVEKDIFPTFEECMGILDLAIFFEDKIANLEKEKLIEIRESLVYLIAKALFYSLNSYFDLHTPLLKKFEKSGKLDSVGFISLNYDIIIDNAIMKEYGTNSVDYGFNPDYEITTQNQILDYSIPLYKLHGSLNWLHCPECKTINVSPFEKQASIVYVSRKFCSVCNSKLETTIVPPTFYKDLTKDYLRTVYKKAEELLVSSKNIFVCGYSFPDADMHIKYLLKKAELMSSDSPNVYIINFSDRKRKEFSKNNLTRIEDEFDRIRRFFRSKENVHYTKLSFEDFCKKGKVEQNDLIDFS